MSNTYGTWLRGDPRGWRTRHHREHVEGDYRKPPAAGTYEEMLAQSRSLLKRKPVHLTPDQQEFVLGSIVQTFAFHGLDLIAASLDDHHLHILARFPDQNPRKWIGITKKNAARALSDRGSVGEGGVWGKRSKCDPIHDRSHQVAVYRYIERHESQGARVWLISRAGNEQ